MELFKNLISLLVSSLSHAVIAGVITLIFLSSIWPAWVIAPMVGIALYLGREQEAEREKLGLLFGLHRELVALKRTLIKPDFYMAVIGAVTAVFLALIL